MRSTSPEAPRRRDRSLAPAVTAGFAVLLACLVTLILHPLLYPGSPGVALAFGAVAVPIALWLPWIFHRVIVRDLSALSQVARQMAVGDLRTRFDQDCAGDLMILQHALEAMRERMFAIIAQVRSGTAAIATTSNLMKADNAALSSRTEVQAGSLEETASSTEELTATVRLNAENARSASAAVEAASAAASEGGRAVANVVDSMAGIRERSGRIAEIIGVIDGIAFQTNILALNAAVEAARAGDQGRGFSVVAGEVRSLSQRCAQAAQEIRTPILGSVDQVKAGSERVQMAGRAMDAITAHVQQVAGIVAEIAAATQEQSAGIEEINRAVVHIDGMTQQNAGLVEEVSRTVATLHEEAEQLVAATAGFELGAREFGSAEEAVALVKAGVAFARTYGDGALVAEVNKLKKGRFIDRDLYLSVYHTAGLAAAHGASRRFWNIDWTGFKDADGRLFVADMVRMAGAQGSGWIDYKWTHPVTKNILVKTAYFERCGEHVIACGVYKQGQPQAGAASPALTAQRAARALLAAA